MPIGVNYLAPVATAREAPPAKSADLFVDSIGINTHTFFNDTAYYSDFDLVKKALAELGVRHVREDLVPDRTDQYERLNELADMGIGSTLIMGDPNSGSSGLEELISIVRNELDGAVEALEGPNEFDMRGGADWNSQLNDYQARLYEAVRSDPRLGALPIIGPSVVQRVNQEVLGNISTQLDYGNIHPYPDGDSPESNLSVHLERAAVNSGAKPVMATETGYHTALGWTGEHNPVSEQAMAIYLPRIFLEYFRSGVARTYAYELLDQKPLRHERENNFGLLRNDFSQKPAFVALRNLIDILEDPGPGFSPGAVGISLGGETDDVHHVLLQKRDGSYHLAIWRAARAWNPESQSAIESANGKVNVVFDRRVERAELYMPNVSNVPLRSMPSYGDSVTLNVGTAVAVVKLDLGAKVRSPARVQLWVSRRSVPAGGRVAVRARLPRHARGNRAPVAIQRWRGRWRTVGRGRASRRGTFRRALRLSPARFGRRPRLRVIARRAKPSRSVLVRIRRGDPGASLSSARPVARPRRHPQRSKTAESGLRDRARR